MIELCVTADDYGLSRDVNAGIHSLAARDALSAVSVMVHREAQLDDVSVLRGRVVTGLHLMLVGERPLRAARLAPLLDAQGFLPMRYWGLFLQLLRHPGWLARLSDEIAAQVARYRTLGLPLHFINSHQHVHLLPPIWARVLQVVHGNAFPPAMRTAQPAPLGGVHQALLGVASRLAGRRQAAPARLSLQAIGLGFAGRSTLQDIDGALQRLGQIAAPRGRVLHELVVHPGLGDAPPAARHGAWGIRWRREHDLLLSDDFAAVLRRHGAAVMPAAAIAAALESP
ncbi:MAG: ChbG/HpnK family deacetylase [bacterium]